MTDNVRTDETAYWELYSDALHDVTVQLNTMRNRLAWISERSAGFKLQRSAEHRAETVTTVRTELRDVCNRTYRDALDALSKLEAMVGMEIESQKVIAKAEDLSAGEMEESK